MRDATFGCAMFISAVVGALGGCVLGFVYGAAFVIYFAPPLHQTDPTTAGLAGSLGIMVAGSACGLVGGLAGFIALPTLLYRAQEKSNARERRLQWEVEKQRRLDANPLLAAAVDEHPVDRSNSSSSNNEIDPGRGWRIAVVAVFTGVVFSFAGIKLGVASYQQEMERAPMKSSDARMAFVTIGGPLGALGFPAGLFVGGVIAKNCLRRNSSKKRSA